MMMIRALLKSAALLVVLGRNWAHGGWDDIGDRLTTTTIDFEGWVEWHGKSYPSADEFALRHEIFLANAQVVERHNRAYRAGLTSYAMALTSPFADLTDDEFARTHLMASQNCSATHTSSGQLSTVAAAKEELPSFVDWRTRGVITPIKNQKHVSRVRRGCVEGRVVLCCLPSSSCSLACPPHLMYNNRS